MTITSAFWHRTRREFTPMTADDLANRTKLGIDAIAYQLRHAMDAGHVTSTRSNGTHQRTVYSLTDAGRASVMAGMVG